MPLYNPYRRDCVDELEKAVDAGARGVKWLPPGMGMNPGSPLCDRFYTAMSKLQIPLLTHGREEKAVHGANTQDNGNPLHLKRALAHGLRVILAHCTMLDNDIDLDKGKYGPRVDSFELFSRMMGKPRYDGQLYGEISD